MANKARHAFGSSAQIESALSAGKIDSFDILFLDGDTDNPKIGWIDKQGNPVILTDEKADLSMLEAEVAELESQLAQKATISDVESKIDESVQDIVETANAYTDGKIESALNERMAKKYDISAVPEGTLVDYREKEIRIMCPVNTVWKKQSVGPTGNANMYYMCFKAYAPDGAVSFKEGDRGVIIDKMYDFDDDFAGTDEFGRNYSLCWLALASYDESTNSWTYFGKNSSTEKYIGWDYIVEWYDANSIIIASDCIRINLSNEDCHHTIEPYYVANIMKGIDEKLADVEAAIKIIEF